MTIRGLLQRLLPGQRLDESDFCLDCEERFAPDVCETCGAIVADRELHEQWHADEAKRVMRAQRELARR